MPTDASLATTTATPASDTVITVEGLRRGYGGVDAVSDLSFSVVRGEVFGILGPNGAGKTTTVECLQGLRARDAGIVDVLGIDPARHPERLRRRIGAQLQAAALPDRLRVGEAVQLVARLQRRRVDVEGALEEWDLTALRRRAFATLSGGQRQRLFLALALLGDPEVVFLDELTAALDPSARRSAWELVRRIRDRGATVVLVTHVMEEAEALCDRVAIVDRGRIVALDTPTALTSRSAGGVRITFTTGGRDVGFLERLPGVAVHRGGRGSPGGTVATVTADRATAVDVAVALAEHGVRPTDFRTHYPTLEDVFLARTGHRLEREAP